MMYFPVHTVVSDASLNDPLNPLSLPHTYTYNSDGTLATDSCTDGVKTWVKTFTYTSGNLTAESAWVRQ
jgi:hypothetical protein